MKMNMRTGFTLIELLIVAAVVAVLAAIAVPNYVEAQARSKVSRVHADMRTLGVALEAYAADNMNNYCFDLDPRGWPFYVTDVLSTPVAYVCDVDATRDPFRASTTWYVARRYRLVNMGANGPTSGGPGPAWPPSWMPKAPYNSSRWIPELTLSEYTSARGLWGSWKLVSAGPDGVASMSFVTEYVPYDPTNGTVSGGDIVRCQKFAGREPGDGSQGI